MARARGADRLRHANCRLLLLVRDWKCVVIADRRRSCNRQFVIVLPVRNGGEYLKACVGSILSQTHEHFRLIVLDNASTDGTVAWLRQRNDARISVRESSAPLTIEENWARIASLDISTEFMSIIGHDDLFFPEYLTGMAALIDAHPDACLYHAHFQIIDRNGRKVRSCLPMPTVETAESFLAERLQLRRDSFGTGYMYRASDYLRVGGIPLYKKLMFADDALWLSLMRGSYKATLRQQMFSYRLHPGGTSHMPDWKPTLESLGAYLDFLFAYGDSDSEIKSVLERCITEFMVFWFRWAYFSAKRNSLDRAEILAAIAALSAKVACIQSLSQHSIFSDRVKDVLFGKLPHVRWLVWQVSRFLRGHFLTR